MRKIQKDIRLVQVAKYVQLPGGQYAFDVSEHAAGTVDVQRLTTIASRDNGHSTSDFNWSRQVLCQTREGFDYYLVSYSLRHSYCLKISAADANRWCELNGSIAARAENPMQYPIWWY